MHLIATERADTLRGAENAVAQRMIGEVGTLGMIVGGPRRLVFIHADLFDDDVLLHLEVVDAQARAQNVRENIHCLRNIFGQDGSVKDGILFTCEGVVVGADLIEVAIDIQRRAPWRALEHHVLQEVRHAGNIACLVARPRAHEKPQRHRPR